ncbi:MAG: hypothetical protein V4592_05280 [Bacteroidota bacterium]
MKNVNAIRTHYLTIDEIKLCQGLAYFQMSKHRCVPQIDLFTNSCKLKKPSIFRPKAFKLDVVELKGLRSNFLADLQAIENAAHFMTSANEKAGLNITEDNKRHAKRKRIGQSKK